MDGRADRRIARTRNALLMALVGLMQEKEWNAIQIAAICERADVSRSTFYAHFDTKNDLLLHGFARLEAELGGDRPDRGLDLNATFKFVPALLDHVAQHAPMFARMKDSPGRAGVFARFRAVCDARCRAELRQSAGWRRLDAHAATFLQGGVFGLVEAWQASERRETPASVLRRIDAVTGRVLSAFR